MIEEVWGIILNETKNYYRIKETSAGDTITFSQIMYLRGINKNEVSIYPIAATTNIKSSNFKNMAVLKKNWVIIPKLFFFLVLLFVMIDLYQSEKKQRSIN